MDTIVISNIGEETWFNIRSYRTDIPSIWTVLISKDINIADLHYSTSEILTAL